jgi:hypothetical protein
VANDVVLSQMETQYDGDGNVLLQTDRERFHDAAAQGAGAAGELGTPTSMSQPHARGERIKVQAHCWRLLDFAKGLPLRFSVD